MSTTAIDQAVEAIQADAADIADQHPLHRELTAGLDRCETSITFTTYGAGRGPCNAQAFHLVILQTPEGKDVDLVYCNHHFEKYEAKLKEKWVYHSDQTEDKLNVKASASSPD